LKILFYCPEYPPAKNGGIGTVTKIVSEGLVRRGHNVIVVGSYPINFPYYGEGKQPNYQKINGVDVYSLFHFSYLNFPNGFILKNIRKIIKKLWLENFFARKAINHTEKFIQNLVIREKIDVIELPDFYNLIGYLKQEVKFRKFSVPTVLRVHGSFSFIYFYRNGNIPEVIKKNEINHFSRCDLFLSVSNFSKSFISQILTTNIPSKVIYNPIEDSLFTKDISFYQNNVILFFGTISEGKGIVQLFKAFNRVVKEIPMAKLVVIGVGNIKKLKQHLTMDALQNVLFKGFMVKEELMEEIKKSTLCVLPSYFENFSMAALEVLANRRTLIYTNRCSGPEVIENNINGILVNPDDDLEIANAIINLLKNPTFNTKLAKQGYLDCRIRFSETQILTQLEREYQNLIMN